MSLSITERMDIYKRIVRLIETNASNIRFMQENDIISHQTYMDKMQYLQNLAEDVRQAWSESPNGASLVLPKAKVM